MRILMREDPCIVPTMLPSGFTRNGLATGPPHPRRRRRPRRGRAYRDRRPAGWAGRAGVDARVPHGSVCTPDEGGVR